jgi:nucleotide-binding universal stress UspA family protein
MKTYKKILMPTDFSQNAQQALRYASMIAKKLDADLTLLHVLTVHELDPHNIEHNFPDIGDFYAHMERATNAHLDNIDINFDHYHTETIRGISPADEIIKYADKNEFELIIMGTHGRSAISHFLMGSVAERVVRHAPCPVITVAHQEKETYRLPTINKIVLPIDFSEFSKQVVEYAVDLAKVFDAKIEFLHILDQRVHPSYYIVGHDFFLTAEPELPEKALKTLQEFISDISPSGVVFSYAVQEGVPHNGILEFAESVDADLIMMTTHGLSGLEKMLIGSTTEKVVRKANMPVFTINAHLFEQVM